MDGMRYLKTAPCQLLSFDDRYAVQLGVWEEVEHLKMTDDCDARRCRRDMVEKGRISSPSGNARSLSNMSHAIARVSYELGKAGKISRREKGSMIDQE